jgi:hypothetical protein
LQVWLLTDKVTAHVFSFLSYRQTSSLNECPPPKLATNGQELGQDQVMPEPTLHERLVRELKIVRRCGLHRLRQHLDELPALVASAEATSGAGTAEHVEGLLRAVWTTRSEGAQGTAIGLLLGLEQGRRGASPTLLRKAASERLGYFQVDTFRKKPEANAIATFADLIESYLIDFRHRPLREDYRIEKAISAIEELNAREYGEMVRRLRARYTWFNTDPEQGDFREDRP